MGDLDGDGDFDLAVSRESTPPGFSILKNRGNGTFDSEVTYSVTGTRAIALGDLDGDEDLDLAVACNGTALQLFTNDAQGTFTQGSSLTVGTKASTVTIEDLNGDGRSDIVSGNTTPPSISVLLNVGRGQFAAQVQYIHFGAPTSIAIADLDGDGDPDLATTNTSTDTVSVRLNAGDGEFSPQVLYRVGSDPRSVVIGFLDRNPGRDIAVANAGSSTVSVLSNNGFASFGSQLQYPVAAGAWALAIADIDGDGDRDLLVPADELTILRNAGNGDYSDQFTIETTSVWTSVTSADFDGDGDRDVALGDDHNFGFSANVTVLFNDGDGEFPLPASLWSSSVQHLAIADLNGDGARDLVTVAQQVRVHFNDGSGTFAPPVLYGAGTTPVGVAIGDLDGDRDPDIVCANLTSDNVSVLLNHGDGTYSQPTHFSAGSFPGQIVLGDADGDQDIDLIVCGAGDAFRVFLNNGDGTFNPYTSHATGALPSELAFDDLDGDGDRDVAVAARGLSSNGIAVHMNQGNGTFAPYVLYGTVFDSGPSCLAIGDLDADGDRDIAVGHTFTPHVVVMRNQGDGTFSADSAVPFGDILTDLAIDDIDGDGDPDIAALDTDNTSSRVVVLSNSGTGTFGERTAYGAGTPEASSNIVISDLNRDGSSDFVLGGSTELSVLLSRCR